MILLPNLEPQMILIYSQLDATATPASKLVQLPLPTLAVSLEMYSLEFHLHQPSGFFSPLFTLPSPRGSVFFPAATAREPVGIPLLLVYATMLPF